MSLQWKFVASFMYMEVVAIALLMLPFIKPRTWQKLFHSRAIRAMSAYGNIYFNVFMAILIVLFLDAIRDVRKYSEAAEDVDLTVPNAEAVMNMKLFRSQRNLYIAGFAVFLWMVLSRMCTLISTTATLMASNEASITQAKNASDTATKYMEELDDLKKSRKGSSTLSDTVVAAVADSEVTKELKHTQDELEMTKKELEKTKSDLSSIKKQAEGVSSEYDRLLKEHSDLQKQSESSEDTKKDS
ncbi:B-cell receptor-associated protein 31 [Apostichopus japonicus]|uniref:Endoplasmic reticulum transmembrane protein n=1 Tax=Stichopus japonicus TaxID=307972 RepID=A0A2G8JX38_STIJA|nr:B-cell receptor-associated protein 31 [Apostichopus japonicus]